MNPTVRIETILGETMVTIPVEGGYEVSLITHPVEKMPLEAFALYIYMFHLAKSADMTTPDHRYRGTMLPSLLFKDLRPDFSPMTGMYTIDTNGGRWSITQAQGQIRWGMGPQGISAVAAFAAAVTLEGLVEHKTPADDIFVFGSSGLWALRRTGYVAPLIVGSFTRKDFSSVDVNVQNLYL